MTDSIVTNLQEFAEDNARLWLFRKELPKLAMSLTTAYECLIRLDTKPFELPDDVLYFALNKAEPQELEKMAGYAAQVMQFFTVLEMMNDGEEFSKEAINERFQDMAPNYYFTMSEIHRLGLAGGVK